MAKHLDVTDERAHMAELVDEVARDGSPIVLERQGTPVAVLVSVEQFERAKASGAVEAPTGPLAVLGLWADVGDDVIDDLIEQIYAEREGDYGRPVDLTP